jgi:hypothetical protein
MTDESCVQYCAGQGYAFAGTEYTDECCELSLLIIPLIIFVAGHNQCEH